MRYLSPTHSRGRPFAMAAGLAAVLMLAVVAIRPASAADHADAPVASADPAADLADVYAFVSPDDAEKVVVIMTVNGLTAPMDNESRSLEEGVEYVLHFDGDGDLIADASITVTADGNGNFALAGVSEEPLTGEITPPGDEPVDPIVNEFLDGALRVFIGQTDDPFFFDLAGFQNYLAAPFELIPGNGLRPADEEPSDTLAGLNVTAIVIEFPISIASDIAGDDGILAAWATTARDGERVDRMAIPAINTALIPSDLKNDFNQGDPVDDAEDFRPAAQETIQGLRDALEPILGPEDGGPLGDLDAATVAGALIPDVVTIDLSMPVAFPNGRTLTDDVVDAALGIVLNRGGAAGVSDAIDGNDVEFRESFPFLAPAHQVEEEPTPTATATSEPTATPTQPAPTATATMVPPTATATSVPPTATPTRMAPMPPDTGTGTGGSDGSNLGIFAGIAAVAALAIGATGVAWRRRTTTGA